MSKRSLQRPRIIVSGKLVHDCGARLVHAHYLGVDTFLAKLQYRPVNRADTRQVPYVRVRDVDADTVKIFPEINGIEEIVCGGEEKLAQDSVGACATII